MKHSGSGGLDRLIPFKEVAAVLGVGVRTLERRIAEGSAPKPIKHGRKRVYPESVVASYINVLKGGMRWRS